LAKTLYLVWYVKVRVSCGWYLASEVLRLAYFIDKWV
jgi:hypothetical protein